LDGLPIQISDIEKWSSRDSPPASWPSARFPQNSSPETGLLTANLRKDRHFRDCPKSPPRDLGGWLGKEDSNRDVPNSSRSRKRHDRPPWIFGRTRIEP